MAQTKKKTMTKTAKKQAAGRKTGSAANMRTTKKQQGDSNIFFVISMSMLVATLLFADLFMIMA